MCATLALSIALSLSLLLYFSRLLFMSLAKLWLVTCMLKSFWQTLQIFDF